MTEKPYTDTDVKLVAATFIAEAKKNPIEPGTPPWLGVQTRMLIGPTEHDIAHAVLDALTAAGWQPPTRTPILIADAIVAPAVVETCPCTCHQPDRCPCKPGSPTHRHGAGGYCTVTPATSVITIERPNDEEIEIHVNGQVVASANHDDHGWSGMDAVEKTALAVARACGAHGFCDCESYDCAGECCGVGNCSCTPAPGDPHPRGDAAVNDAVQKMLDDATRAFAAADNSSERVEVIRDLLADWYAAWPSTAVTDEHEGIAHHLVSLIYAAEARAGEQRGKAEG